MALAAVHAGLPFFAGRLGVSFFVSLFHLIETFVDGLARVKDGVLVVGGT